VEVERGAPALASSEIEVAAPPEVVWDVLADFWSWPRWNPEVKSLAIDGPVSEGTQFKWKTGPLSITSILRQVQRPAAIGWTGKAFGIDAVHVWRFQPRDGGTLVHTEESWSGWLPRLLRGPMRKTLQKGLDDGMPHLKGEAERRAPGR
jgi:uncharacterized protein YndB with AHSA1/START domain